MAYKKGYVPIFTEEHRRHISEANKGHVSNMKGKHHSDEANRKNSEAHKGKHPSLEARQKMSRAQMGNKSNLGRHLSAEHRRNISEAQKGEGGSNWRGGITTANTIARSRIEYRLWREAVFARDAWTCQECGKRSGSGKAVYLHAHHVKSFAECPELRTSIENGLTLCQGCHKLTGNFGRRKKK